MKLNLLYKLSYLNSNFTLTLGYLNPALNNPVLNFYYRLQSVLFQFKAIVSEATIQLKMSEHATVFSLIIGQSPFPKTNTQEFCLSGFRGFILVVKMLPLIRPFRGVGGKGKEYF